MSQLRSFGPWLAYPVATRLFGWQAAAAIALGVLPRGLALGGRPPTTDVFRVAALVFFAALTAGRVR